MVGARCGLLAAGLALLASPGAAAQGRCNQFEFRNTPNTRLSFQRLPSGNQNIFIGAGVNAYCASQNLTIIADSAEHYGDLGIWYLIGRVHYVEPRVNVKSRRATYWTREDRLLAEGDVVAALPSGTFMRGPRAEYWREIPNVRPRARLVADGRPRITLVQRDTTRPPSDTGARADTVDVTADRVILDGDSLVYAGGRVEITRPDIVARGDSAFMDRGREYARLTRQPSITGSGARPFTLQGRVIDSWSKNRRLERVVAAGDARATSRDMVMSSDTIDMRIAANLLVRAFVWGSRRASVESPSQRLLADSLDVIMPGQRLAEVRAVGAGYAESAPDTLRLPRGTARDWLRGDTVTAYFDTATRAPAADTARGARLERLVAVGTARSLYHLEPTERNAAAAARNYVRGRRIVVAFVEGQVDTVTVSGDASGVYTDPTSTRASTSRADTTAAPRPANAPATPPRTP